MRRAVFALVLSGCLLVTAGRVTAAPLDDVRAALAAIHAGSCKAGDARTFDYQELARRGLGRHWRDRTEAERAQLVGLVRGHFLGWYARLCQRQDLMHFETAIVDGDRAVLGARAIREGHAVSIVYRLRSADATHWLVYDVEVAGRSHAATLYAEVDRILLNEGYPELIARLAAEQDLATASPAAR